MQTVTYQGDAAQLQYIRNRYNVLLTRKDSLEAAVRVGKYSGAQLALLIETQDELLRIDEARTRMVNPKLLKVEVNNIKIVTLKPKTEDNWALLLENNRAGEYRGRDSKHRAIKQEIKSGKYKQKHLITI